MIVNPLRAPRGQPVTRAIVLSGIVLLFGLLASRTGFTYPFGQGRPEWVLDWTAILVVLSGILVAPGQESRSPTNRHWWGPEVWTTAAGSALIVGYLPLGILLLALGLWGFARAEQQSWFVNRTSASSFFAMAVCRARAAWTERGLLLLGVGALLLLLKAWDTAKVPGGPKAYQVELGCYGVVLALLGIAWAGRTDGTRAVSPAITDALSRSRMTPARLTLLALLPLAGVLLLGWLIQLSSVEALDVAFIHRAYRSGGRGITTSLHLISNAGGRDLLVYWAPLIALLLAVARRARALRFFAISQLGVFGLETIAKPLVYRLRPDFTHGRHFDSFPSGHTMAATILAGALLLILMPAPKQRWQQGLLCIGVGLWPLLMGASRVYLGRHYLTDVLGGLLLGIAWVLICLALLLAVANILPRTGDQSR